MKRETLIITDMHCPACVMRLESLEDELKGVNQVNANYKKQTLLVEFDEMLISSEEIKQAVIDLGYSVQS